MAADNTLVEALFDFAVARPDGFTNAEFMDQYEIALKTFNQTANKLRAVLADDTINLVCDPAGSGAKWNYRLVGSVEDGSPWVQNRLRDAESRFNTISSVVRSLVNATDGRSVDGRKARVMDKAMRRLVEDLNEITTEVA